jgi:hypothetical protein
VSLTIPAVCDSILSAPRQTIVVAPANHIAEDNGSRSSKKPIGLTRVNSDEADLEDRERDSDDDSDEDGFAGAKFRGEMYEEMQKLKAKIHK